MGISVEPPHINISEANFTTHGENVRFGLDDIKNLGGHAIEFIVAARKELGGSFRSIYQFCEKVDLRVLNKRVLESLIKSGAMDSLGRRAQVMTILDRAMEQAQKTHRDAEAGQHGLFGVFDDEPEQTARNEKLPEIADWDEHTRLQNEKEVLGFFVSGHPLEKYRDKIEDFRALSAADALEMKSSTGKGEELTFAGVISGLKVQKSKKGDMYARGSLQDMTGSVEMFVFPEAFKRLSEKVKLEVPVLVRAGVRVDEGSAAQLAISEITPLEDAKPKLPRSLRLTISVESATEDTIDELHSVFASCKGDAKVMFNLESPDFVAVMEADGYNVLPDRVFLRRIEELCGRGSIKVID